MLLFVIAPLIFIVSLVIRPRSIWTAWWLMNTISMAGLAILYWLLNVVPNDTKTAVWINLSFLIAALVSLAILGIAAVHNDLVMWRKEGRSPANLLSLAAGVAILAYFAFIMATYTIDLQNPERQSLWWPVLLAFPLMYIGYFFCAYVAYSVVYGWWSRIVLPTPKAVIVLGSGLIGDRVPPLLASRLDKGRTIANRSRAKGTDAIIVCSVGQGPGVQLPEGEAMRDYLIAAGEPADHVLAEKQSTTTEENLKFSTTVLAEHNVTRSTAVVTNNYHALRAALMMQKLKISGHAFGATTARYFWPSAMLREFIAVLWAHKWVNGAILAMACLPLVNFVINQVVSR